MKKNICIITGSRAEYGLLKPLIDEIQKENNFQLQLIVTGSHLSPEFGLTYKLIEDDKIRINEKIDILLSSNSPTGISKSMGLGLIGFSESFDRLRPDLVIVLGDRFEIFSAVIAAYVANIPVAHIHGGETTEGVIDEGFRHSITKMSYLHFTSTEEYRKRVIQLGENPDRVFNVGAIGLDNIKQLKLFSKEELVKKLNINFKNKNLLITFHPETIGDNDIKKQFQNLLDAMDELNDTLLIFTKSNADKGGRIINKMIDEYCEKNDDKAISFTSIGQLNYLSVMQYIDAIVGNSSSGIIEAPSFKIATVNIGDRQKGRIKAESVIDCEAEKDKILKTLNKIYDNAYKNRCKNTINPFYKNNISKEMINIIKTNLINNKINLKKHFYDIKF